jgi:hypothetical protein
MTNHTMSYMGETITWKHNGLTGPLSAWDPKWADGSTIYGVPSIYKRWSQSVARKALT